MPCCVLLLAASRPAATATLCTVPQHIFSNTQSMHAFGTWSAHASQGCSCAAARRAAAVRCSRMLAGLCCPTPHPGFVSGPAGGGRARAGGGGGGRGPGGGGGGGAAARRAAAVRCCRMLAGLCCPTPHPAPSSSPPPPTHTHTPPHPTPPTSHRPFSGTGACVTAGATDTCMLSVHLPLVCTRLQPMMPPIPNPVARVTKQAPH